MEVNDCFHSEEIGQNLSNWSFVLLKTLFFEIVKLLAFKFTNSLIIFKLLKLKLLEFVTLPYMKFIVNFPLKLLISAFSSHVGNEIY